MSESTETPNIRPGHFCWNELLSGDVEGSKAFYTSLLGWTTEAFGPSYILFKKDGVSVGGLMQLPQPGTPAQWLSYILVEDVDATAAAVEGFGGKVMAPPFDVPEVGRLAVILDPQGVAFGIFKGIAS